jgi:hypothetical protein
MRIGAPALVAGLCGVIVGMGAAPTALGKVKPCKHGTVAVKVSGHRTCLAKRLALPAPAKVAPGLAQFQGALALTQVGFAKGSGKKATSLPQRLGRSWTTARSRLLNAMAATLTRITKPLRQSAAARTAVSQSCQILDVVAQGGTFDIEGRQTTFGGSFTSNGVSVSMGVTGSGAMQLGMKTTVNGDTYTMSYESGENECTKAALPKCPEADGSLDSFGVNGKVGFSMTVARGGNVLTKRSYAKTITVETKGKVADDAKLDSVDVRYGETTVVDHDGLRYTSHATRLTHIDMRSGTYGPGESVSFGSATQAGEIVNTTGIEADAGDFAAFVNKTISEYRERETAWQTPNACAKLTFDPQSGTVTLNPGDHGTFSGEIDANQGGGRAAAARWTLSAQQNGSFSPTTSQDRQPSFTYNVSGSPSGSTVSVNVKATSTAGVAQDTWSQNLKLLNTITGTFTGHATHLGVIYDWSGSATFTRIDLGTIGAGGVFQLTSGQATVTVSGSEDGSGCDQTGQSTIPVVDQSPWTVFGNAPSYSYDFIVGFLSNPPQATNIHCSDPNNNNKPAGLGSMPDAALQSGDDAGGSNRNGLVKTTSDLYSYVGSATVNGPDSGDSASWTWSFTGSP